MSWNSKTHSPFAEKKKYKPFNPKEKEVRDTTQSDKGKALVQEHLLEKYCKNGKGMPQGEAEALKRVYGVMAPDTKTHRTKNTQSVTSFGLDAKAMVELADTEAQSPRKKERGRRKEVQQLVTDVLDSSDVGKRLEALKLLFPIDGTLLSKDIIAISEKCDVTLKTRFIKLIQSSDGTMRDLIDTVTSIGDKGESNNEVADETREVFMLWGNGTGVLSFDALRAVISPAAVDDEALKEIVRQFDHDQDNALDLGEFSNMMQMTSEPLTSTRVKLYFQGDTIITTDSMELVH